ncbi:hypothetical protein BDR03DRAFT_986630 [Suillus americanus]|nr:hypothetical protein BDR03DRAFT_986630 [Suillus americanus]
MDIYHRLAPQRHSEFWFEDGNIVFHASDTLFCVHWGVLVCHSPALEGILAMPSGYDTDSTEQLPIVLHQISEQDFTHFLNWVYHMCKEGRSGFWWKKVAHVILHPTNPLSLTQTLQFVIEAQLPDELDGLEVEERIIEGVIRAVTSYFSSL